MALRKWALLFSALSVTYLHSCTATHALRGNVSAALHAHHASRQDRIGRLKEKSASIAAKERPPVLAVPSSLHARQKIPRVLHYVYLKGFAAFKEDASKPKAPIPLRYFESCQAVHKHWSTMIWDMSAATQLLQEHYPWFLPVWKSYPLEDMRAEALRPFILHHFGGLYLDLDTECYRASDGSLQEYDVVLQGNGDDGFSISNLASVPGHSLWDVFTKKLVERSNTQDPNLKRTTKWMTGTTALTQTILFNYLVASTRPVSGYLGGNFTAPDNTTVHISPLGEWFAPCYGLDLICVRNFERQYEIGEWNMTNIYGRHYFASLTQPDKLAEGLRPHNVTRRLLGEEAPVGGEPPAPHFETTRRHQPAALSLEAKL